MKRWHQIIFLLIALLALGTFVFGLLQFVNPRTEPPPARTAAGSNAPTPGSRPPVTNALK